MKDLIDEFIRIEKEVSKLPELSPYEQAEMEYDIMLAHHINSTRIARLTEKKHE